MVALGTVTGQEIRKNRDGVANVRLLQVRLSNDSDIQTVQYMPTAGEDSPPQIGDLVAIVAFGPSFLVAVGIQDSVVPTMGAGEKKVYSNDGAGAILAFINFLAGGDLELNGNANTAVRFTDLETAFNALKSDYNTHVHAGVTSGGASTAIATPQSTADMSGAESPTVKLA